MKTPTQQPGCDKKPRLRNLADHAGARYIVLPCDAASVAALREKIWNEAFYTVPATTEKQAFAVADAVLAALGLGKKTK